jgi:predicted secreted protein
MRFWSRRLALALAALSLFVLVGARGDAARRTTPPGTCQPSAMLSARVATLEHPVLTVEQNQLFVISVGTNPSTGYHWVITPAKPVAFGFVGSTYRDGTPLRATQQYDQYGQPIQQSPQQQYDAYGRPIQPQQYDVYGRPIQRPNPYGQQLPQQQTYNPYGLPTANPYPRQSQIVGIGGEQLLIFKAAVPPGVETMVMQYAPPGQPGQQAPASSIRSQTFTIEVIPAYGNC